MNTDASAFICVHLRLLRSRTFGGEGFEKTVDQVAAIEKQLGIYELEQFTPKMR